MRSGMRLTIGGFALVVLCSCGGGGDGGGGGDEPAAVATVTVSPSAATLQVGESQQFTTSVRDGQGNTLNGRTVSWQTSAAAIATVSASGLATAIAEGSATITATAEGVSGTANVTIENTPVATVTIEPAEATVTVGGTVQLAAVLRDASGKKLEGRAVTWTTGSAAIASVSTTGLVTGVAPGSTSITAASEGRTDSAAVSVVEASALLSMATGGAHTCALDGAGQVYCWGRGESGQLGVAPPSEVCMTDDGSFPCSTTPIPSNGGLTFRQLTAGGAHTCGLTDDGTAYCWGDNSHGQVGDDSTQARYAPVEVATALRFESIDGGAKHTCALTSNGAGYCWGRNDRGQLGDGSTTHRHVPVAVTGGRSFAQIVAGGSEIGHTCGLVGDVGYCWGDNERGQLGIGSANLSPHSEPAQVAGSLEFTQLTAGLGRHTCGRTAAGAAYCWGENTFGGLGDGTQTDRDEPVAVMGGLSFVDVVAGGFLGHSCGRAAGKTYCWGENERGQVGDGSNVDRLVPVEVAGDLTFDAGDLGFRHSCARATPGGVYCWGSNGAGQLGIGSTDPRNVPTQVMEP